MDSTPDKKENCDHTFKIVEEYTGGTDYVCTKCGEKKTESTLLHSEHTDDGSEYVLLDLNTTTILYSSSF